MTEVVVHPFVFANNKFDVALYAKAKGGNITTIVSDIPAQGTPPMSGIGGDMAKWAVRDNTRKRIVLSYLRKLMPPYFEPSTEPDLSYQNSPSDEVRHNAYLVTPERFFRILSKEAME